MTDARVQANIVLHEPAGSRERLRPLSEKPKNAPMQMRKPGPMLLLGPPGVGKGTQGNNLAKLWGVPTISTGQILRANIADGTALGAQATSIMKLGGLVPDHVITEMIADRLGLSDTSSGFILDGFPRTIGQAQWLNDYLSAHRPGGSLAVISMFMDPQRIIERLVHRRVCPRCESVYHAQYFPPKLAGRCDRDGFELETRSDDCLEIVMTRLEVFRRETEPLIHYYRNHALLMEINADRLPEEITSGIVLGLAELRKM